MYISPDSTRSRITILYKTSTLNKLNSRIGKIINLKKEGGMVRGGGGCPFILSSSVSSVQLSAILGGNPPWGRTCVCLRLGLRSTQKLLEKGTHIEHYYCVYPTSNIGRFNPKRKIRESVVGLKASYSNIRSDNISILKYILTIRCT